MFLKVGSLEKIKKLDKLYIVMILHAMNPDFPCVPTLKDRNFQVSTKSSIMVSTHGKGGCGIRRGPGGRRCPLCMYCKKNGSKKLLLSPWLS